METPDPGLDTTLGLAKAINDDRDLSHASHCSMLAHLNGERVADRPSDVAAPSGTQLQQKRLLLPILHASC